MEKGNLHIHLQISETADKITRNNSPYPSSNDDASQIFFDENFNNQTPHKNGKASPSR
jgi:hypothetical protein